MCVFLLDTSRVSARKVLLFLPLLYLKTGRNSQIFIVFLQTAGKKKLMFVDVPFKKLPPHHLTPAMDQALLKEVCVYVFFVRY